MKKIRTHLRAARRVLDDRQWVRPLPERALRWLLRLPQTPLDPTGNVFEPAGDVLRWTILEGQDLDDVFQAWHRSRQPRREGWVEALLVLANRSGSARRRYKRRLSARRGGAWRPWRRRRDTWQQLAEAEHVRWVAWHDALADSTTHVDGRLILPSGDTITLDMSCVGDAQHWAERDWLDGDVATSDVACGQGSVHCIVLPTETLSIAACREGLIRWYMQRMQFHRGAWSVLSQSLPSFELDVVFFAPADEDEAQAEASLQSDRRELDRMRLTEQPLMWWRFGRPVDQA